MGAGAFRSRSSGDSHAFCHAAIAAALVGGLFNAAAAAQQTPSPDRGSGQTCLTATGIPLNNLITICEHEIAEFQEKNAELLRSSKGGRNVRHAIAENNYKIFEDREWVVGAKHLLGDKSAVPPVLPRSTYPTFNRQHTGAVAPTGNGSNWNGQIVQPGPNYCEDILVTANTVVSTIPIIRNLTTLAGQEVCPNRIPARTYLWGGIGGAEQSQPPPPLLETLVQNGVAADITCPAGSPLVVFYAFYEDVADQPAQLVPALTFEINPGDTVTATTQVVNRMPAQSLFMWKDGNQTYVMPYTSPNANEYIDTSNAETVIERACGDENCQPMTIPAAAKFNMQGQWTGTINNQSVTLGINQNYVNPSLCLYTPNNDGICLLNTAYSDTPTGCDSGSTAIGGKFQVTATISAASPSSYPTCLNPGPN